MGDIEKLEFDKMDNLTKNILGKEVVSEINEHNGLHVINEEEVRQNGGNKRSNSEKVKTFKQQSWDEVRKSQEPIFENAKAADKLKGTLSINEGIPNSEEFFELLTVLKDENGADFAEFLVAHCGWKTVYALYRSSKLFDVVEAMKQINRSYYFENNMNYEIKLANAINKNRDAKRVVIHISGQQKREIQRLLQDIKITESNFALAACVCTFNKAKDRFDGFVTPKYRVYYKDDGYFRIIEKEFEKSVMQGIEWIAETIGAMYENVNELAKQYLYDPDICNPDVKEELIYKMKAMEKAAELIKGSQVQVPLFTQLCISSFTNPDEWDPLRIVKNI